MSGRTEAQGVDRFRQRALAGAKTRYMAALDLKSERSLRVTAAYIAHNALDKLLDARRDDLSWESFRHRLD